MFNRLLITAFTPLLISCAATISPHSATSTDVASHEYASLTEKDLNYKDWTYTSITDGRPVNLRSAIRDKKLVLVVYFAPWCGNWRNEMPVAIKLHDKYKELGFEVIGVSEYGSASETTACFGDPPPFVIVAESQSREDREHTLHHEYRRATGDQRKWGSPWNIFIDPLKVSLDGDVILKKAWVVNGELIDSEVEQFIRRHLDLE